MTCPPDCADCAGTYLAVDAGVLRSERAARDWWESFRVGLAQRGVPDLIRLARPAASAELAVQVADHGQVMRGIVRSGLAADARHLDFVTRLRELAAGDPDDGQTGAAQARLDLMSPAELNEAAVTQEILATVADGFGQADMILLSRMQSEELRLAAGARAAEQARLSTPRVDHRMLSDPGLRQRLGVHGAIRDRLPRADGSGRRNATDIPEDGSEGNAHGLSATRLGTELPARPTRRQRHVSAASKKRGRRRR